MDLWLLLRRRPAEGVAQIEEVLVYLSCVFEAENAEKQRNLIDHLLFADSICLWITIRGTPSKTFPFRIVNVFPLL